MTKEEWVELFQAMNGRDPSPQEFMAAKQAGEFDLTPVADSHQPIATNPAETREETVETPSLNPVELGQMSQTPLETAWNENKETGASPLGETGISPLVPNSTNYQNQAEQARASLSEENSYFDGGIIEYLVFSLGAGLLIFLTLGIMTPWAVCFWYRWKTRHTVIGGRRLGFNGTAWQLFGNWIKWFLLSLITFGIYGLWLRIKLEQWVAKHTYFDN